MRGAGCGEAARGGGREGLILPYTRARGVTRWPCTIVEISCCLWIGYVPCSLTNVCMCSAHLSQNMQLGGQTTISPIVKLFHYGMVSFWFYSYFCRFCVLLILFDTVSPFSQHSSISERNCSFGNTLVTTVFVPLRRIVTYRVGWPPTSVWITR